MNQMKQAAYYQSFSRFIMRTCVFELISMKGALVTVTKYSLGQAKPKKFFIRYSSSRAIELLFVFITQN